MATADSDGLFITIDVGEIGRNSDGGVFNHSNIGKALREHKLKVPPNEQLPNDCHNFDFPFYFAADEAFPLCNYIMRPFPKRSLTNIKRVFNYRLSRGRKSIECAFGMLVSKFRVFESSICAKEETINNIVKAACVLHNFIRTREGRFSEYNTAESDQQGEIDTSNFNIELLPTRQRILPQKELYRNYLANYFVKPENTLPWLWKYCT